MRKTIKFFTRIFFRILNRIEVKGLENIPPRGRLIIACNHLSNSDPPALMSFISLVRDVNVLAKKELFVFPLLGPFLRFMGAVPLERHREGGDISAFRKALRILENDGCLLVFPEGTRAKGRKLPPKMGVAMLARKTLAPILPAAICGSENFAKLGKINIRFGKLMAFKAGSQNTREEYKKFTARLMENIHILAKERL